MQKFKRKLENVLFVDPGLGGTGIAYFKSIQYRPTPGVLQAPLAWDVLKGTYSSDWEAKVEEICVKFSTPIEVYPAYFCVFEFPGLWATGTSHASASSGDLFKLTYLLGSLAEVWRQKRNNKPILIKPSQWKGQLPKDVVRSRIKKFWPQIDQVPEHASDAIGMGFAAQGGI